MHCTEQDNSESNMMNDENVMLKRFGVVSLNPQPLCSSYVLFTLVFLMNYAVSVPKILIYLIYTCLLSVYLFK